MVLSLEAVGRIACAEEGCEGDRRLWRAAPRSRAMRRRGKLSFIVDKREDGGSVTAWIVRSREARRVAVRGWRELDEERPCPSTVPAAGERYEEPQYKLSGSTGRVDELYKNPHCLRRGSRGT